MPNPVVHFEVMGAGNAEGLQRFYAEVFEWKVDANNPMNYGSVDNGGEGINGGIGAPPTDQSYVTFYIQVDDLQKTLDKVESLGGKTAMPPMDVPVGDLSIAMFTDPSGNLIGLAKGM